jgi:hypothetical protein
LSPRASASASAAPDRFITYIAMQEVDDQGSPVTWGE